MLMRQTMCSIGTIKAYVAIKLIKKRIIDIKKMPHQQLNNKKN